MPTSTDYKKEWFNKAQIDYYSAFINLWLSCNSWYTFHYGKANDRENVNAIKTDATNHNKLYLEFKKLYINTTSVDERRYLNNLEMLHFALLQNPLNPDRFIRPLNFDGILVDYSQKNISTGYQSIVIPNAKTRTGKLKAGVNGIDLGSVVFKDNSMLVFAGLFEIIYQVRCMLVHGDLVPTDKNYNIIKYSYMVLYDLMYPFCS